MRVLLTGATGFIGAAVARRLVLDGDEVHAVVRPGADATRLIGLLPALRVVAADLASLSGEAGDTALLRDVRPDACIHLACYAVPGKYLHGRDNLDCLRWTVALAEALADAGCGRFVGAGTCVEYDTAYGYLAESTPTRPASLYAACKHAAFEVVERMASQRGLSFAWTRFFYQYGPSEHPARLVPVVIRRLLRGERAPVTLGEQVRDFLHVDDVAAAVVGVARSSGIGAFNVGSGQPVTVRQLVELIGELCDAPELIDWGALPYRDGDPAFVCANAERLRRTTGWEPHHDLASGLRDTITWWREKGRSEGVPDVGDR